MELDLNAQRAARAEKAEVITVLFGVDEKGKALSWQLNREIPLEFLDMLAENRMSDAIALLLADPDKVDLFLEQDPTVDDLNAITEAVMGADTGNSRASARRSRRTGKR